METQTTRVAIVSIIIEDATTVKPVNDLLHEYSAYIIGRMGLPYPKRSVNIISVAVDAPQDAINALSGALGAIAGVSVKTAYSRL